METQTEIINKAKEVKLTNVGVIEQQTYDNSEHWGKKVQVDLIKEFEGEYKGKPNNYIVAYTKVLGTFKHPTKGLIELRANKRFYLARDSFGTIGWTTKSQLGKYLEQKKLKHYNELVGCEVTVLPDQKGYLTFQ